MPNPSTPQWQCWISGSCFILENPFSYQPVGLLANMHSQDLSKIKIQAEKGSAPIQARSVDFSLCSSDTLAGLGDAPGRTLAPRAIKQDSSLEICSGFRC